MKRLLTYFLFAGFVLLTGAANAQNPTIYASVASGSYNVAGTWETFTNSGNNTPGAMGTGTPASSAPSGTHYVYIRSGHTITMNGGNRSCFGMMIEAGGKLWANEAAARRLQLVNGGTGFTYPQTGTITNNGTMGGLGDGLYFEAGTNAQNITITGSGSTIVQRLRVPGGFASSSGGVVNITIDQDITFTQANNYAVSLIYNPQPTDNYTLTLNAGKTLTISDAGGYFNNNSINSGSGFGHYTYNINGTLDLSASTQTTNQLTAFSPTDGIMDLNLNGGLKTGMAFNSSPVAPGVANLVVGSGVTVDAKLATVMNFNENSFTMSSATSALQRTVPSDGSKVKFPVGTALGSSTGVSVSCGTGADEIVTVSLQNSFTHAAPANSLPREWNISEATSGGNADTLRFEWTAADEANGFAGTNPVFVGHWDGSAWAFVAASVSGAGTSADPYVAKAAGSYSTLGLFILSNSGTTPVALVNVKAYQKQNGVQVEFGNATETDILNYVVEESADGRSFTTAGTLLPKSNNGALNTYSYFDAAVNNGNNFYRIKVTERNGSIKYSNVLNVKLAGNNGIAVYPNPVKGNSLNLQLQNLDKAVYNVTLFNEIGQQVFTKQITHDGRTASFVITLPSGLNRGIYSLHVSSSSFKTIKNLVVE